MKLWLLRPVTGDKELGHWKPWYDKCFGFVVRAESAKQARDIAAKEHGDEPEEAWTDPKHSTCTQLKPNGAEGVIIKDFAAG